MFAMIVLLGLVVSLDGFTAALSYGAQRIRLTPLAVLLVSLTSAATVFIAMSIGQMVSSLLDPELAHYIGSAMLVILGCYLLLQHSRSKHKESLPQPQAKDMSLSDRPIAELKLRAFGLVVQILHDPASADQDHSGVITWKESLLLGVALALDAFGAGIGAAFTGLPAGLTAVALGFMKIFALLFGWDLGYRLQGRFRVNLVGLPGLLLIGLGLINLVKNSF